jgi:hypothetical protein
LSKYVHQMPVAIAKPAAAPAARSRWLSLGGLVPMSDEGGLGLRGEIDLVRRGSWVVGAAASIAGSEMQLQTSAGYGNLISTDVKAIGYLAHGSTFGRWHMRPSVGVGVMYSNGHADDGMTYYPLSGTFPTFEASLVVSREIGAHWAAYTGPLATVIAEKFESQPATELYPRMVSRSTIDIAVFAGVGRRL